MARGHQDVKYAVNDLENSTREMVYLVETLQEALEGIREAINLFENSSEDEDFKESVSELIEEIETSLQGVCF